MNGKSESTQTIENRPGIAGIFRGVGVADPLRRWSSTIEGRSSTASAFGKCALKCAINRYHG